MIFFLPAAALASFYECLVAEGDPTPLRTLARKIFADPFWGYTEGEHTVDDLAREIVDHVWPEYRERLREEMEDL